MFYGADAEAYLENDGDVGVLRALQEDKWIHQLRFRCSDSRLCFRTLSHFKKESAGVKHRSGVSSEPGTFVNMFSICLWGLM